MIINFALQPFPATSNLPQIEINGRVNRKDRMLSIEYQLFGDLNAISIAPPASTPSRQFHLWEATCFEFFIGIPGDANYWEFNLSPSGDWAVFALDDYRQGLRDELAFTSLPFKVDRYPNYITLSLEFDLSELILAEQDLEMSVTTVIKSSQDELSYWAISHSGKEADFHLRDSFSIEM
jgi:hypothetical protein